MTININDRVRVKLTDIGRRHLRTSAHFPVRYWPKEDADGWSVWTLHELANTFGPLLVLGCESPFETEIQILGHDSDYDVARKQAERIVNTSSNLLQAAARIRGMVRDDA